MKKIIFTLQTYNGKQEEIEGLGDAGLVIHKDKKTSRYIVSHINSGFKIKDFDNQKVAKLYVGKIKNLTNWEKQAHEIKSIYNDIKDQLSQAFCKAYNESAV